MDHKPNSTVTIGAMRFGNELPLALIAGPCALESRAHALEMATALKEIAAGVGIGLVYKTSFDKANRTSAKAKRGIGLDAALPIFAEIRDKLKIPVLTDVHDAEQCARVARRGRRVANPGVPLPADRSADRRRQDGQSRQRQERPVPGALGHEERGREDHRRRTTTTCW